MNHNFAWAPKGTNINVAKKNRYVRYTVTAAISNKKIIHLKIIRGSANAETFRLFLDETIGKLNNAINYKFLLDNARIHHSHIVRNYINTKNNINLVFNIPYTPETNPIENIFSVAKNNIKGKPLNNNNFQNKINASFNKIKVSAFKNCFTKSLDYLFNL